MHSREINSQKVFGHLCVTSKLPTAYRYRQPPEGIVKNKVPNGKEQRLQGKGKKLNLNISKNETLRYPTQIPAYAVPYIANNNPTGLSDLEIELIDGFMASIY